MSKNKLGDIGLTLRQYRLDNNLNQKQMADIMQLSQQQYSVIERNMQKPTFDFVKKFRLHTGINLLADPSAQVDEVDDLRRQIVDLKNTLTEKNTYIRHVMDENEFLRLLIAKGGVEIDTAKTVSRLSKTPAKP